MNIFRKKYLNELRNDVMSYIENILTNKDKKFVPRGDYLEMMSYVSLFWENLYLVTPSSYHIIVAMRDGCERAFIV